MKYIDIKRMPKFPDDNCHLTAYNRILRVNEIEDFEAQRIIDLRKDLRKMSNDELYMIINKKISQKSKP